MSIAPTRFVDLPAGHPGRRLLAGVTPWFSARADQRFVYSLFVPEDLRDDEPPLRLWVFVHGTGRRTVLYLDAFAELARQHRAAVLTPLFPVGIDGPDDVHNYKRIESGGVRYDEILLGMVDEVAARWRVDTDTFFLHGFSGGGQFSHRFALLHPERLAAVSIGAPGQITLPTPAYAEGLGRTFDAAAFAAVPTQVVVGSLDDDAAEVAAVVGDPNAHGRLTQAGILTDALRDAGAQVRLDVVRDAAHDGAAMIPVVTEFLLERLTAR